MRTSEQPAVVFLHGWLMGPWMWAEAASKLSASHRNVILTQPSHGAPGLPVGAEMADWAAWLQDELAAHGAERAVLVGHSMGGMLALDAAARYPDTVLGLCLVSTTDVPWAPQAQQFFLEGASRLRSWDTSMAFRTAQSLLSPGFLERNPDWLAWWFATVREYDFETIVSLGHALATRSDQRQISRSFTGPAIVVHGDADPVFPVAVGEELASRLDAPLALIAGAGHAPPLEASSEFAGTLDGFLERHFGSEQ